MIKNILKQMWYQRKQNSWILIELIIIAFFLWRAIDPIFIFNRFDNFEKGHKSERSYVIDLLYQNPDPNRQQSDEAKAKDYYRLVDMVKLHPQIEDVSAAKQNMYPGGSGQSVPYTSKQVPAWNYNTLLTIYQGHANFAQNFMNVIGFEDVKTGMTPAIDTRLPIRGICYLSETAAANLFPNGENPIGQSLWSGHDSIKVAGIIKDVRTTYGKLSPMIVRFPFMKNEYDKADVYDIILKVKPEVDLIDFEKKFRTDFLPTLKSGAFSVGQFESMDSLYEIGSKVRGVDSQKKLRYILSMFFICCAFFGITGTFWIKCNKQRSQIGLLRAMGSTKAGIIKKFYIESGALVTVAYIIALIPLAAIIALNNEFDMGTNFFKCYINNSSPYIHERFLPHFAIVSLITYAILMVTAFVGTYITAYKYSNLQPSEALRDE